MFEDFHILYQSKYLQKYILLYFYTISYKVPVVLSRTFYHYYHLFFSGYKHRQPVCASHWAVAVMLHFAE